MRAVGMMVESFFAMQRECFFCFTMESKDVGTLQSVAFFKIRNGIPNTMHAVQYGDVT